MGEKDRGMQVEEPKLEVKELTEQAVGLMKTFKDMFPGAVTGSPHPRFFNPKGVSANYEARYLKDGTTESFFARRVPTNGAALGGERRELVNVVVFEGGKVLPSVEYERVRQHLPEDRLDKHGNTATAVEKVTGFLNGIPKEAHNT